MTPPTSPGYLPPERAQQIRDALSQVVNPGIRGQVLGACEAAFADGYALGYDRGLEDGAAEVSAHWRAVEEAHRSEHAPQPPPEAAKVPPRSLGAPPAPAPSMPPSPDDEATDEPSGPDTIDTPDVESRPLARPAWAKAAKDNPAFQGLGGWTPPEQTGERA